MSFFYASLVIVRGDSCRISVSSAHTNSVAVDCPEGYHCDDRSNCVCNANTAGGFCVHDSHCCNQMKCDIYAQRCGCISDRNVPVESSWSNCCSRSGAYWPTYSASYCYWENGIRLMIWKNVFFFTLLLKQ